MIINQKKILSLIFTFIIFALKTSGQNAPARIVAGIPVNYSEDSVGVYTLPDPLILLNGKKVTNSKIWFGKRRPEIVKLYEECQFGRCPGVPKDLSFKVTEQAGVAFDGKAIRRQVTVYFTKDTSSYKMDLLIYLPARSATPVPLLFNVSFSANASTVDDPGIKDSFTWSRDRKRVPAQRNMRFGAINPIPLIEQGIGVATVYYGDIEPDFAAGIKYGIRGYYLKPGTTKPGPDDWGAIAAWAWGLSRVNDFPVDAHMLLALIAPRPVLLQTGDKDFWSDPKGEFLAAVAATPVYKLLGKQGLGTNQMPQPGQPVLSVPGYYMHAGGHGALPADWDVFLAFFKKYL